MWVFLLLLASSAAATWWDPVLGCRQSRSNGERVYTCHTGSSSFDVRSNYNEYVNIKCKDGIFRCEDMPHLPLSSNHTLDSLTMSWCHLPSTFACVLKAVNATGVKQLILVSTTGTITAENVKGLEKTELLLDMKPEQLKAIPYDALPHLSSLKDLRIIDGHLQLTASTSNTPNLRHLDISGNRLKTVPRAAFKSMPGLKTLVLVQDEIKTLKPDAFLGLAALKVLDLSLNPLLELEDELFQHTPQLERLIINHHNLRRISSTTFANLGQLRELQLEQSKRTTTFAPLTLESSAFALLPSLTTVTITNTALTLPSDLFLGSRNLTKLVMSGCGITPPKELLAVQKRLKILDLSRNQVRVPRDLLRPLEGLQEVDLSYNLIEVLPEDTFTGLYNLHTIRLDHNQISSIKPDAFLGPRGLMHLSLSNNHLALCGDTHVSPFQHLNSLKTLNLSHNAVKSICDDWRLSFVHHIETIDLSWNRISKLEENDLQFLGRKLMVDLSHNNISRIEAEVMTDPHQQLTVRLDYNPLVCDCRLYPFLNYTRHHSSPTFELTETRCARPAVLEKEALTSLPLTALTCPAHDCPPNCTCLIRPATNSLEIECNVPPMMHQFPAPYNYRMNHTKLTMLDTFNYLSLPDHVVHLNISGIGLTHVPQLSDHLKVVDLRFNSLKSIPAAVSRGSATVFYLRGNPFECSCSNRKALTSSRHNVADAADVDCADGFPLFYVNCCPTK